MDAVKGLCDELNIPYTIVSTEIGPIIFDQRHEKNPCSLCAKMRKGSLNDVAKKMQEVANNVFVSPIIDSVTSLPIEELALFAESMINITSVRRRVAIDGNIGTVGGPIDVAIVTRGDGLIWLKRKHYFEAKKNPQFMYSRYGQPIHEVITNEDE